MDKTEFLDSNKKRLFFERLKLIANSVIFNGKEENIEKYITVGEKWDYKKSTKTIECSEKDLLEKGVYDVLASAIQVIAIGKYQDGVVVSKKDYPKNETKIKEFMMLANIVDSIRLENAIVNDLLGTHDFLLYKHRKDVYTINKEVYDNLEVHNRTCLLLSNHFAIDEGVKLESDNNALEFIEFMRQKYDEICKIKNVKEVVEYTRDVLWDKFKRLMPPFENKNNQDNQNNQNSQGSQNPQDNQNSQTLQDNQNSKSNQENRFADVEEMKQKIEGLNSGNNNEEVEKMDKEYDEKFGKDREDGSKEDDDFAKEFFNEKQDLEIVEDLKLYKQYLIDVYPYINYFSCSLSKILKDNKNDRYVGRKKSGRIDKKGLYRFGKDEFNVFKKKQAKLHKDYGITLMIDESGSMKYDKKIKHALRSIILFAETLNKVGLDFEIIGFNAYIRIYKEFGKPFNNKIRAKMVNCLKEVDGNNGCGTNDAYAINYASDRLFKMNKEKDRILISISDGEPCPTSNGIDSVNPKDVARVRRLGKNAAYEFKLDEEVLIAKRHNIVFGVGVMNPSIENYYGDSVNINEVSELPVGILQKMKTKIKRG